MFSDLALSPVSAADLLREVAQARKYGISHGSLIAAIGAS